MSKKSQPQRCLQLCLGPPPLCLPSLCPPPHFCPVQGRHSPGNRAATVKVMVAMAVVIVVDTAVRLIAALPKTWPLRATIQILYSLYGHQALPSFRCNRRTLLDS